MLFHIIPYDSTKFHMIPYLPSERSHFIACCLKGFNEAFAKNKRIPMISASLAVQVSQERGIPRVSSIMTLASTTSLSMVYATSCSTKVWQLLLKRRYLSTSKVLGPSLKVDSAFEALVVASQADPSSLLKGSNIRRLIGK